MKVYVVMSVNPETDEAMIYEIHMDKAKADRKVKSLRRENFQAWIEEGMLYE